MSQKKNQLEFMRARSPNMSTLKNDQNYFSPWEPEENFESGSSQFINFLESKMKDPSFHSRISKFQESLTSIPGIEAYTQEIIGQNYFSPIVSIGKKKKEKGLGRGGLSSKILKRKKEQTLFESTNLGNHVFELTKGGEEETPVNGKNTIEFTIENEIQKPAQEKETNPNEVRSIEIVTGQTPSKQAKLKHILKQRPVTALTKNKYSLGPSKPRKKMVYERLTETQGPSESLEATNKSSRKTTSQPPSRKKIVLKTQNSNDNLPQNPRYFCRKKFSVEQTYGTASQFDGQRKELGSGDSNREKSSSRSFQRQIQVNPKEKISLTLEISSTKVKRQDPPFFFARNKSPNGNDFLKLLQDEQSVSVEHTQVSRTADKRKKTFDTIMNEEPRKQSTPLHNFATTQKPRVKESFEDNLFLNFSENESSNTKYAKPSFVEVKTSKPGIISAQQEFKRYDSRDYFPRRIKDISSPTNHDDLITSSINATKKIWKDHEDIYGNQTPLLRNLKRCIEERISFTKFENHRNSMTSETGKKKVKVADFQKNKRPETALEKIKSSPQILNPKVIQFTSPFPNFYDPSSSMREQDNPPAAGKLPLRKLF